MSNLMERYKDKPIDQTLYRTDLEWKHSIDGRWYTTEEAMAKFPLDVLVKHRVITDTIEIARIRLERRKV